MILSNKKCRECPARFVCAPNMTPRMLNCKNVHHHLEMKDPKVLFAVGVIDKLVESNSMSIDLVNKQWAVIKKKLNIKEE